MNEKILKLLEKNARMTDEEIACALDISEKEVTEQIAKMETSGEIRGYKCVVDRTKTAKDTVSAIIELKVTPKVGLGFDEVAEQISSYPQVESVFLMSGSCDIMLVISGSTFQEVSSFVANELAVIDSVTNTSTQFVMRRYKEFGVEMRKGEDDGRGKYSL